MWLANYNLSNKKLFYEKNGIEIFDLFFDHIHRYKDKKNFKLKSLETILIGHIETFNHIHDNENIELHDVIIEKNQANYKAQTTFREFIEYFTDKYSETHNKFSEKHGLFWQIVVQTWLFHCGHLKETFPYPTVNWLFKPNIFHTYVVSLINNAEFCTSFFYPTDVEKKTTRFYHTSNVDFFNTNCDDFNFWKISMILIFNITLLNKNSYYNNNDDDLHLENSELITTTNDFLKIPNPTFFLCLLPYNLYDNQYLSFFTKTNTSFTAEIIKTFVNNQNHITNILNNLEYYYALKLQQQ